MKIQFIQEVIDFIRGKEINEFKPNPFLPTHEEKVAIIGDYAKKYGCQILVETGTCMGDTIDATKNIFKQLYTIELSQDLYKQACKRFEKDDNIKLFQGDSTDVLPEILKEINEKALFWLDGHYSAGNTAKGNKNTPILEEINAIYKAKDFEHVLLIDDARCFGVEPDYPTIEELKDFILSKWQKIDLEVDKDIIRVVLFSNSVIKS